MLATTLDVDFDPDKSWDEKKEIYRISNKIVRTSNITQSAVGDRRGLWTTTIAAAVLILEEKSGDRSRTATREAVAKKGE
jgi:arginine decarboxylase